MPFTARLRQVREGKARRFSERHYVRFERIPLEDVEKDRVSAAFKNGVLSIMPKSTETKNVRHITIDRNG